MFRTEHSLKFGDAVVRISVNEIGGVSRLGGDHTHRETEELLRVVLRTHPPALHKKKRPAHAGR